MQEKKRGISQNLTITLKIPQWSRFLNPVYINGIIRKVKENKETERANYWRTNIFLFRKGVFPKQTNNAEHLKSAGGEIGLHYPALIQKCRELPLHPVTVWSEPRVLCWIFSALRKSCSTSSSRKAARDCGNREGWQARHVTRLNRCRISMTGWVLRP